MCELLGINTNTAIDVNKYLYTFFSHSVNHPHGWGIMRSVNGRYTTFKEPVRAIDSGVITDITTKTEMQTNLLAHIRLATVGITKYNNCHPFTGLDLEGRQWTLIHNGTIYSGTMLMKYLNTQIGETDSERIFIYLLNEMNDAVKKNGAPLTKNQRFEIINRLVTELSPRNKLNLMIFDGDVLYVHKNMKDTLYFKEIFEGYVFSTQPLDDEKWSPFPTSQVIAYKNGAILFEGTPHGHEFVPTLEYITALDAMNI